jgi:hypothetical protein
MGEEKIKSLIDDRRELADKVVRFAGWTIVILSSFIVLATVVLFLLNKDDTFSADKAIQSIHTVLATLLPLFGAWVGAVIAFYFARENLDAASQSARAIIQDVLPDRLASIPTSAAMVPLAQLEVVRTPADDGKSLSAGILQHFRAKGLSRLPILNADDTGKGVFHDSTVQAFVLDTVAKGGNLDGITLKTMLDDPDQQKILAQSVVYTSSAATLAQVRAEMDKKSKDAPTSVRDAFVTSTGDEKGKVIGYLSDVDIGNRGALK